MIGNCQCILFQTRRFPMKISGMTWTLWIFVSLLAAPAFGSSCDSLTGLKLKDTTVTMAQVVTGGQFSTYKNLPDFCRVAITIKPTSDSDIKVEVWLPANNWNGKFQGVGNGGWAGVISYSALADAIRAGYASASTDTGHSSAGGSFA